MLTYLTIKDFRRRKNKKGQEYGMAVTVYATPECLFGADLVTSFYAEDPEDSYRRILSHVLTLYPDTNEAEIKQVIE